MIFADPSQKLLVHEPFLCAACNLTGAEFAQIVQALGFDLSTPLNLANVSALYRNGWLAHALGLSVLEFLRLKECTGLDPFAPLDLGVAAQCRAASDPFHPDGPGDDHRRARSGAGALSGRGTRTSAARSRPSRPISRPSR